MSDFNFELIYKLRSDEDPETYIESLYGAGCDDAMIEIGTPGHIALEYLIDSEDFQQTFIDAIKNVKRAIPHAKLQRIEPYRLNSSELAYYFGFSKQNMRKYISGQSSVKEPFPEPSIPGKTSYWYLLEVAIWFSKNTEYKLDKQHFNALKMIVILNREVEKSLFDLNDLEEKDCVDALQCA